jgi:hypothetical protein
MKKSVKTIEQLTEEFFAAERAEYEKRVPAAFPRVEVKGLAELSELTGLEETPPVEEEKRSGGDEESVRSARK